MRALDEVDVITGISGGSFTALAFGLYGDKLFDEYEKRFLKRDVQGELISRALNPSNWGPAGRCGDAADPQNRCLSSAADLRCWFATTCVRAMCSQARGALWRICNADPRLPRLKLTQVNTR